MAGDRNAGYALATVAEVVSVSIGQPVCVVLAILASSLAI
jgi:hypothetical protein